MTIDGRRFVSDLIIYENGTVEDHWRRRHGHRLLPEDISALLGSPPNRLIIGTGASGRMAVDESLLQKCSEYGIDVKTLPTGDAATHYNQETEKGASVAACFHLTC